MKEPKYKVGDEVVVVAHKRIDFGKIVPDFETGQQGMSIEGEDGDYIMPRELVFYFTCEAEAYLAAHKNEFKSGDTAYFYSEATGKFDVGFVRAREKASIYVVETDGDRYRKHSVRLKMLADSLEEAREKAIRNIDKAYELAVVELEDW